MTMSNHPVRKPERFLSRQRIGWAGLSAVIGCAAGALPLLASVGLRRIAAVWRRRYEQHHCADGCGLESSAPTNTDRKATEEPIACTLDPRDMQARVDEYRAVFGHIIDAERFDHGFAWRFRWDAEVEAQVRALVAKEQDCCRF